MGILMLLMHNLVAMQPVDSRLHFTLHNFSARHHHIRLLMNLGKSTVFQ